MIFVRSLAALAALALPLALSACDECAWMPSCHNPPEVSASGQLVDRVSGQPLPGGLVSFVRDSGVQLHSDTLRAVTDVSGFFTLRGGAFVSGTVFGHVLVDAPPKAPYTKPRAVARGTPAYATATEPMT